MGKHLTSPLRNVLFFSLSLSSPLRAYSLSFYLSLPLISFLFSYIPSFFSLLSPSNVVPFMVLSTNFCCFTVFLHLRCFGRKLGAYIPEIFALLVITCDPIQYFSLFTLLQYRHIPQCLILSILSNSHIQISHIFAMESNQNIKL